MSLTSLTHGPIKSHLLPTQKKTVQSEELC